MLACLVAAAASAATSAIEFVHCKLLCEVLRDADWRHRRDASNGYAQSNFFPPFCWFEIFVQVPTFPTECSFQSPEPHKKFGLFWLWHNCTSISVVYKHCIVCMFSAHSRLAFYFPPIGRTSIVCLNTLFWFLLAMFLIFLVRDMIWHKPPLSFGIQFLSEKTGLVQTLPIDVFTLGSF